MWNWHDYLSTSGTCSTEYNGTTTINDYVYIIPDIVYYTNITQEPEPEIFFDPKNLW